MGSNDDDDLELLARWRGGDNRAAQILIRRHYPRVKKFFSNAVPDDVHRDLTQDTFRKVVAKREQFEGRSSFKTYLLSIARFTLIDYFKAQRKGQFEPLEHSVVDAGAVRPSEVLSRVRRHANLLDHVRALPLDTKQLLELYIWQDCTAQELGEIFELRSSTIKTRIAAAKKKLAKQMAETEAGPLSDGELEARLRELGEFFELGPTPGADADPTGRDSKAPAAE